MAPGEHTLGKSLTTEWGIMTNIDPSTIRLVRIAVVLEDGETYGARWTLGPEWYEANCDEEICPYFRNDDVIVVRLVTEGSREYEEISEESIERLHVWAESTLALTSDYRIVGWKDDSVPQLHQIDNTLEIELASGATYYVANTSSEEAQAKLRLLLDPHAIMIFKGEPRVTQHGYATMDKHIPVRHIESVTHITERTKLP